MRAARRTVLATVAFLAVAVGASTSTARGRGDLGDLEKEFRRAIERATPATVVCVPWEVPEEEAGSSSGVVVTRSGFVLSDGDVGLGRRKEGDQVVSSFSDQVEVRVADLERGGFAAYRATVVARRRGVDSTLLRIEDVPAGDLHSVRLLCNEGQAMVGIHGRVGQLPDAPVTHDHVGLLFENRRDQMDNVRGVVLVVRPDLHR